MGRLMRAPDHAADGGGDDAGSDPGSDGGSDDQASSGAADDGSAADDTSLLGSATDTGAGGEDKTDDGKVSDGDGDKVEDGDGKKDGDDADDDKPDDADDKVPEAAYQLEPIKIGEGDDAQTVEIDTKLLEDVTPMLKDAGITQGTAKKLAPMVLKVQEQVLTKLGDDHAALIADWEKQARADKDIGGAKMDETLSLAARALDKFGAKSEIKEIDGREVETNEFRALLNQTGVGNHPVMLKMFREIGKLVGEDGELIRPDVSPAGKQDRLEVLYPDDVPKK